MFSLNDYCPDGVSQRKNQVSELNDSNFIFKTVQFNTPFNSVRVLISRKVGLIVPHGARCVKGV